MDEIGLLIVLAAVLGFALIARRLETTILTAPMVFLATGVLLAKTGWMPAAASDNALELLAEITLIVLLFLDASQIDLRQLRHQHIWPQRMLLIGLPLTIAFGTIAGWLFFPTWPWVALALAAALLAPTDAALGQAVVMNENIPERVRRGLTVESGLNDGLALPAVLLFASLTAEAMEMGTRDWLLFGVMQIVIGPIVGAIIGYFMGIIVAVANDRGLTSDTFEGVAALSLALLIYFLAELLGGNGFMAAFIGGLCFGNVIKGRCDFLFEFTESEGQMLMWGTFLLVGLVLVPEALAMLDWRIAGLVLVSFLIARPLAIWLSLWGTDTSPTTRLFFGWFGPRGLATAIFALLVAKELEGEYVDPILAIAINAVWISALLHGITAAPLGRLYAHKVKAAGECAEGMAMDEPFDRGSDRIRSSEG